MSSIRSERLSSSEGARTTAGVLKNLQDESVRQARAHSMPEDRYKGPSSLPTNIPLPSRAKSKTENFLLGSSPGSEEQASREFLKERVAESYVSDSELSELLENEAVRSEDVEAVEHLPESSVSQSSFFGSHKTPEPEFSKTESKCSAGWGMWDIDNLGLDAGQDVDVLPIATISLTG